MSVNNTENINTINLDQVCCAGCNIKQKSDEFEEDINGDMWCPDCYASLKDKFKKSYKCDAPDDDGSEELRKEIADIQAEFKKTCDEANGGSADVSHWGKRRIEGFHAKYPRQQIIHGRIYNRPPPSFPKVCCLCGGDAGPYGHNPDPVPHQQGDLARCCDTCNSTKVIPLRMFMMRQ